MSETLRSLLWAKGLEELFDLFAAEEIEASMLPDLSDEELKEIGLKLGQRKKFRTAFAPARPAPQHVSMAAERRQLTVVFCDLVGSTALATALDPEDLRDVMTVYLDTAVNVAKSHGGYLAYTQGDGLMIYFGYPRAQEDDPFRAVRASLAIAAAVQDLETLAPTALAVRLGVATGRVVVGDTNGSTAAPQDFVVGETPNLASRLQALAQPNEVIVAGSTKALTEGFFEFEAKGSAKLKGFEEPRPYFAVTSEITTTTRFASRSGDGLQPIVGRTAELSTLRALWAKSQSGEGKTCVIEGPPGIGKSRLVHALYAETGHVGIEWQCAKHLSNRSLHPMAAELERMTKAARSDAPEIRREKLAWFIEAEPGLTPEDLPLLGDLIGVETQESLSMDAQTRLKLTVDALARRVEERARQSPMLIVVEDAHWVDSTTQDFLEVLSDRLEGLPAFVVITTRPDSTEETTVSYADEHLFLAPIDDSAGLELVKSLGSDRALSSALARLIIQKTDGVPLFVEELTKSILDSVSETDLMGGALSSDLDIPTTLQDSLMARLDRLGPAKEIAQLGAVIGREFTAAMVQAITPGTHDVADHLARLEQTELLHRNGLMGPNYFVFNHALVQDTAYESILRSNRQETHLRLARAMLDQHPAFDGTEPEIIARHAELGGLNDEAVTHWMRAGQQALARAANPAAVTYFRSALRCLEHLPPGPERDGTELQIAMSLAPASMSTFGWAAEEVKTACARAAELAQSLEDHNALYGAIWGLWTNFFLRGEMNDALAYAEQVKFMAEQSGSDALLTTADHAFGFSNYFRGDFALALQSVDSAVERFSLNDEKQIVAMFQFSSTTALHQFAAASHWMLGDDAQAKAQLDKALELPETLAHAPSLAFSLAFTQYTLMYQNEWARVYETSRRLARLAEDEGLLMWGPQAEVFLGLCDCINEGVTSGLERVRLNFDLYAANGTRLTLMQMLPSFGTALIGAGQASEAVARLSAMATDAEKRVERAYLPELYRVLGEAHFSDGDAYTGRKCLEKSLTLAQAQGAIPLIHRTKTSLAHFTDTAVEERSPA